MRFGLASCVLALACNEPPLGPSAAIEPASPTTLDTFTLRLTEPASDPNKRDVPTIAIQWLRDGEPVDELQGETSVPPELTTRDQTWSARITTTDGDLDAAPVEVSVTIRNLAPTLDTLTLGPRDPLTDDELVAAATGSDADGDPVTFVWSWSVNGKPAAPIGPTVPAKETLRDDEWVVSVVASDGTLESEPRSASIAIGNTVPSAAAARIDPQTAYETSVLFCKGGGWKDPDGDPEQYEYEWRVNGAIVGTAPTLTGADFKKGDSVTCTLTPVDAFSAGVSVQTFPVLIRNSKPYVTAGTVTPDPPRAGTDIQTSGIAVSDVDGDGYVLRYTWFVDGTQVGTADYLKGTMFRRGQAVKLWINPYDGKDTGSALIWERRVENAPPGAPKVALDLTSGDLVCRLATAASDADADPLTYSATWTRDGKIYGGPTVTRTWTDDVVPAASVGSGTWECALTPDDGFDAGKPGTATRTL